MKEPEPTSRRFAAEPEAVRTAAREAIESWSGEWGEEKEAGYDRIRLPVQAGLRWGVASGSVRTRSEGGGTRLELTLQPPDWSLHLPAVAVLLLAAIAAVAVVLWPFFPALGPLVPLGLLAALGAWFLVVARLQNRGPEELLDTVAAILGEDPDEDGAARAPLLG